MLYRLSYFRELTTTSATVICGSRWIRTTEGENQQIYSLPHLAALEYSQYLFQCPFFGASCRIRTNDPEITNHVLWPTELKRRVFFTFCHHLKTHRRKSGAKVVLFFHLTKYFTKKMTFLCIFSQKEGHFHPSYCKNRTIFIYLCVFPIVSQLPPSNHQFPPQTYHTLSAQIVPHHILLRARAFPY